MKVVQFTIPVAGEHSVIIQEDIQSWFYEHLHRHPEAQITWVIKGEGTLIAGNYMQRFKAGEICSTPGPTSHMCSRATPGISTNGKRRKSIP